jgi:hypothetical protein
MCVIWTSWAHVWRLRSLFLGTGYDIGSLHALISSWYFCKLIIPWASLVPIGLCLWLWRGQRSLHRSSRASMVDLLRQYCFNSEQQLEWYEIGCPGDCRVVPPYCLWHNFGPFAFFSHLRIFLIASCHGFWLDLRVGVLTDMENNGTQWARGFIQVWASMRIKPYVLCALVVL